MAKVTRMTRKGQITIPKDVRDELRLKPFDRIEVVTDGDQARLRKARPSLAEIAGTLPGLGVPVEDMPAIAKAERASRAGRRRP